MSNVRSTDVVPGDILQIEEGTIIPADGRIVTEDAFLQIDQSALTGESLAVEKHKGDEAFASSAVKRGEAFIIITATGDRTFVGRASALVNASAGGQGHFTEVLTNIGTILLILVVLTLLVVWVSAFYRSDSIIEILEFTLAITVVSNRRQHWLTHSFSILIITKSDWCPCRFARCRHDHHGCRRCFSRQ